MESDTSFSRKWYNYIYISFIWTFFNLVKIYLWIRFLYSSVFCSYIRSFETTFSFVSTDFFASCCASCLNVLSVWELSKATHKSCRLNSGWKTGLKQIRNNFLLCFDTFFQFVFLSSECGMCLSTVSLCAAERCGGHSTNLHLSSLFTDF